MSRAGNQILLRKKTQNCIVYAQPIIWHPRGNEEHFQALVNAAIEWRPIIENWVILIEIEQLLLVNIHIDNSNTKK